MTYKVHLKGRMYVVLLSKSIEDIKYMIGRSKNTTYKYFAEILINPCSTGACV